MAGVDDHSEYDGGGLMPNGVYPKGSDALTASDKLRLLSTTGQTEDSNAPIDPAYWNGATVPDPQIAATDRRAREQRQRALRRESIDRYKESPY